MFGTSIQWSAQLRSDMPLSAGSAERRGAVGSMFHSSGYNSGNGGGPAAASPVAAGAAISTASCAGVCYTARGDAGRGCPECGSAGFGWRPGGGGHAHSRGQSSGGHARNGESAQARRQRVVELLEQSI